MTIAAPQTAERVQRSFTSRSQIAVLLQEARARTLQLIETVSEADLRAQHDPLMGPILWDLGHIGHFEELWLDRNLDGKVEFVEMPGMYNPFEHPRRVRGALPLPTLGATLDSMTEIRERVLERLARVDLESEDPLLRGGYVYQMVLQHEYQHNETMLQTLQLKAGAPYTPGTRREPPPVALPNGSRAEMVRVDVSNATVGTEDRLWSYDNERPRHVVDLSPFWIDRTPVTNEAYLAFIDDGGYRRRELWSDAGRTWLDESKAEAPKYWTREHDSWLCRSMDRVSSPELTAPVIHVCYHEAEAFARWAGKRLPTEAEWEVAASRDPSAGVSLAYPWGDRAPNASDANLDQLTFGVAPVDAYGANVSPLGCYGMLGDVWEWTSTDFDGYPGFEPFPYAEYSQVFFGTEHKVLRGGSWATRWGAIRNTFRNWDYPIRRQIFSGFRCARDD
ncbi:MAG TPA: ergothioneine biosynthesis protein EgtB [Gemmatimonadaceae bacterium]|nr:ergothioneine biosynthesis protein EgtB [Gemmatimonadaceae bacterium]